jgi:Leucine-rich repeat (LRR) protein
LQILELNNNQLQEIPKEIGSLINLEELHLYNNQLQDISKELCNLANYAPIGRPTYK